jgi:hypothetical protein
LIRRNWPTAAGIGQHDRRLVQRQSDLRRRRRPARYRIAAQAHRAVTRDSLERDRIEKLRPSAQAVIEVPNVELDRLGQVKLAAIIALSNRVINLNDSAVFLTGPYRSIIDSIVVMSLGAEYELFDTPISRRSMSTSSAPSSTACSASPLPSASTAAKASASAHCSSSATPNMSSNNPSR